MSHLRKLRADEERRRQKELEKEKGKATSEPVTDVSHECCFLGIE